MKSIRTKIFLSFLAITLIVIIVDASVFYYLESDILRENAIHKSLEMNRLKSELIGKNIEFHVNRLTDYVGRDEITSGDSEKLNETLNFLVKTKGSEFFNIFYFDDKGEFVTFTRETGNILDREYFRKLSEEDIEYTISEPIIGKIGKVPIIVLAAVERDSEGKIIAGLGGSIHLGTLSRLTRKLEVFPSSYGIIISSDGEIIAHPDEVKFRGKNLKDGTELGFDGLEELWEDMRKNESGYGEYYDRNLNKQKIMTYYKIPYSDNWKLGIVTYKEEVYDSAVKLVYIITGISIVLIIILSASTFLLSKRIVAPIIELTKAVSKSQKSEIIQIEEVGLSDEIGTLIAVYNKMAESIHHYTTSLELMVEDRTKELNELNEKLSHRNKKLTNLNDELYTLATTDELTKLLNRSHIIEQIEKAISAVESGSMRCFSIMFIDLDNFKYYNDNFGHDIGDKLLIDLGKSMKSIFRSTDIIGRYGGDEFIVLLLDTDLEQAKYAEIKLQRFIKEKNGYSKELKTWLEKDEIEIEEKKKLALSVGIAANDIEANKSIDELIKLADEEMYYIKGKKKGQIR